MWQPTFAHTLKKGTFLSGLHCARRMWWEIHDKGCEELETGLATQILFDQGNEVGALARERVPGGILIRRDKGNFVSSFSQSRAAVADPSVSVIYEAGFVALDTMIFADILVRGEDGFTLIEVKQGTSVTEEHIYDLAIQAVVMREAGVPVKRFELMHLNRDCRYPDLGNLFVREDVTKEVVETLPEVEHALDYLLPIAKGKELPQAELGAHCTQPRECAFTARCWPAVDADHIRYLYRLNKAKAIGYERDGISRIQDLPDELQLGAIPARQRRCLREGELLVEKSELVAALASIIPPVTHIDFETVMFAIPRWNGCRPYDTIPVQMSAHRVDASGSARHHQWIAKDSSDPRIGIGPAIVAACAGARTVTAYNASFEKRCILSVADACPDIAPRLREIAESIVDLLPIVRENIYHREFRGSFSLKKVLPALVPELSYDDLDIAEGETASAHLMMLLFQDNALSAEDRTKIERDLLAYCERDTVAMIELTRRLVELARS
jgi:predicted RecB family nuclease